MVDPTIIPFQPPLPQVLPTIVGNLDYRLLREQLLRIEQILISSGLERQMIQKDLERWSRGRRLISARAQQSRQSHCQRALRCNIARILLQENFRGFAARLADSPLLQHFCAISQIDCISVPSKSTMHRYEQWWPEQEVRQLIEQLLLQGAQGPEQMGLPQAVDLESAFLDTTCLGANIHYPVDWLLLRDGTRTLMKAVRLIRDQGLKHRMPQPESFISRINALCMEMTHAGNRADSQGERKRTLRQIDRMVGIVRQHARRYRDLLDAQWERTDWTRKQAQQVLGRINQVLELLPKARRQARQRILKGEPVADAQKILSLYEPDLHVIVRRKAGAQVEFGNSLHLAENPQGLLLHWELFRERAPADSKLLPRSIGRMEQVYGARLKELGADRGFDSLDNQIGLAAEKIYNGVCPRSPRQLRKRKGCWKFKRLQRRRAQTEGRIGILKNVFLGGRLRSKGFVNRKLAVSWAVLVHNLWVLARMQASEKQQTKARAA